MKKKIKKICSLFLINLLLLAVGCGKVPDSRETETSEGQAEEYVIGVAVFDPDNTEMNMFMNYYKNYLEEGFPVKFYFSEALSTAEDENNFVRAMKKEGANGIISFYGLDLPGTVEVCQEEKLYYVLGSGTVSEESFNAVKDNPWFLGTVGPKSEEEYQAGVNMAQTFVDKDSNNFLLMTGGSSSGNFMHSSRSKGVLETLAYGKNFRISDMDELVQTSENQKIENEDGTASITLCPGYMESEEGLKNLECALAEGNYDTVLCTYGINTVLNQMNSKEKEQGTNIKIGVIDCFSEENTEAIREEDIQGNSQIDYVEGKYASMVGPAFAMLYNAFTDHKEANSNDREALRLYQGFWEAKNKEEYLELFDYTQGIYENAYDCDDLMSVIKVYNQDTTPEKLKKLAEAYKVEDIEKRIQK